MLAGAGLTTALEVGDKAPDFLLPSTMGGMTSLSMFQGKKLVLLEFYGADFAPTWVANLTARMADHSKFRELNVQLLGVSANHQFSQKTMADSLKLPYPLLSDFPDLKAIRSYGVLHPSGIFAERAFFLIDKEGIVRGKWGGEPYDVFPTEPILEAARELAKKP
jgi:peroxiredoxin Q/BCP